MTFFRQSAGGFRSVSRLWGCTIICGLNLAGAQVAVATDYYVDPAGSDANSGLSPATPFRTITHAYGLTVAGDTIHGRCWGLWKR